MSVKRYEVNGTSSVFEDANGSLVDYEDYAALEARCAALAADKGIETPSTDAFLAEVRAQESKRIYQSILDNPAVTDMESLVDWLEQYANDSSVFASQLRKGVQP